MTAKETEKLKEKALINYLIDAPFDSDDESFNAGWDARKKQNNQFAKQNLEAVRDKITSLEPENFNGIEIRRDCIDFINEQIENLDK